MAEIDLLEQAAQNYRKPEDSSNTKPEIVDLLDQAAQQQETQAQPSSKQAAGKKVMEMRGDSNWAVNAGKAAFLGFLESAGGMAQKAQNLGITDIVNPAAGAAWNKAGGKEDFHKMMTDRLKEYQQMPSGQGLGAIRALGNMAGYAPASPMFKAAGTIPNLASSVMGRIGLLPAAGAAQGGLAGGMMYDYGNQESKINAPGAALGAAGGAIANPALSTAGMMFGALGRRIPGLRGMITNQGAVKSNIRTDQMAANVYNRLVNKTAKQAIERSSKLDIETSVTNQLQKVTSRLKNREAAMWKATLGKEGNSPVGSQELSAVKKSLIDFAKTYKDSIKSGTVRDVQRMLPKGGASFQQLKELRSKFGKEVLTSLKKQTQGGTNLDAFDDAMNIYQTMTGALKQTAKKYGKLPQFEKANQVSRFIKEWEDEVGEKVSEIAKNKAIAGKFINKITSTHSGIGSQEGLRSLGKLDPTLQQAGTTKLLRELMLDSVDEARGAFDVRKFLNTIQKQPKYQAALQNNPQAKMFQSLVNVFKQSTESGASRPPGWARSSGIWGIGTDAMRFLSKPESLGLKKALMNAGLATRNDKMRQYFQNKAIERMIKAGVTLQNGMLTMDQPTNTQRTKEQ